MGLFRKDKKIETKKTTRQYPIIEKEKDWVTIEEDGESFFGQYNESENGKYLVAFTDGHMDSSGGKTIWVNGQVYLIENNQNIVWKKTLERPNNAHVSNDGIVAVEDWLNSKDLCGSMIIFDKTGNKIMEHRLDSNIGSSNISPDGKYAVVSTCNPDNSIYLLSLSKKDLSWKKKKGYVDFFFPVWFLLHKSHVLPTAHQCSGTRF